MVTSDSPAEPRLSKKKSNEISGIEKTFKLIQRECSKGKLVFLSSHQCKMWCKYHVLGRMELLVILSLAIVALVPMYETVSIASIPSSSEFAQHHLNSEPHALTNNSNLHSRSIRSTLSSSKPKKKKVLQVSKRLFNKIKKNQNSMEKEVKQETQKQAQNDPAPMYKTELYKSPVNKVSEGKRPLPSINNLTSTEELFKIPINIPTYDCPPYSSGLDREGKAIIKPDPKDCSCFYYCSWGVHYVQCCSWPLLWNDDIIACDWFFSVTCRTFNGS